MKLIFLGPQGSGKSTQARIVSQKYDLPFIETGQLLRDRAKEYDQEAQQIREKLEKGELVDNKIAIKTVQGRLKKEDCKWGFVLDGYPRNEAQLKGLREKIDRVFFINVSRQESIRRLKLRARFDDSDEALAKRLSIYYEHTEPLLEHFRKQNIYQEVDGERSIEEIAKNIESLLKK